MTHTVSLLRVRRCHPSCRTLSRRRRIPDHLHLFRRDTLLRRQPALGYGLAVALFAAALGLRHALNDALPPGFPYLTFFPAVVVTAFLAGLGPGIFCAVLSGIAAWYWFIPPFDSFALTGPTAVALGFYVFIVAVDLALIHFMSQAADRLDAERRITDDLYDRQRTMFQELQHRVANNMMFVASLLSLQKRRVEARPDDAAAAFDAAITRLETMSKVHRRLYDPAAADQPLDAYLRDLCADLALVVGRTDVTCRVSAPGLVLDTTRLTSLSLLITELVLNALKHAFEPHAGGEIDVAITQGGARRLELVVRDNGRGLPVDPPTGSGGLGSRISARLAAELGGQLDVSSGAGVTARIAFDY